VDKSGKNSEYLWHFPEKVNLYFQMYNVKCTWLCLGEAWCRLGVPETLRHSPWAHLQVLGTGLEWVSSIGEKSSFMSKQSLRKGDSLLQG
jgi:hypothetical protein